MMMIHYYDIMMTMINSYDMMMVHSYDDNDPFL
jgi:hypothetical protein